MIDGATDLMTLGGGALLGKAFSTISFMLKALNDARKDAHMMNMEVFDAQERSMERAEKTSGGVWMRRAIYFLVAFSFVSIVIAGWAGHPIVIEHETTKGILLWKRNVVEYVTVHGVPFLSANKTAFLAIVSFYLGAKV
jgi:hypothetical protein